MDAKEYKTYHELYMRNHLGTTPQRTFFTMFTTLLCTFISLGVASRFKGKYKTICVEYFTIILPLVLSTTLLADYNNYCNIILISYLFITYFHRRNISELMISLDTLDTSSNTKLDCISNLRALIYLITVYCILAVDFRVFPRYLAKTEHVGFSLMDTGTGLFIVASGLTHKHYEIQSFYRSLINNLKLVIILCFLGLSRYILVKEIDYHEHISEYGKHWNFFYTLAICKFLSTFILNFIKIRYSLIIGLCIVIIHEGVLNAGLGEWVFSDIPRDTFLIANREGITSCPGYISLYFFSVYFKIIISDKKIPKKYILLKFLFLTIFLWAFLSVSNAMKPASRTLANLSYCLFILSITTSVLACLYVLQVYANSSNKPRFSTIPVIFKIINENGLLFFIIGNLLTGLINIYCHTLLLDELGSIAIINVYMLSVISLLLCLVHYANAFKCLSNLIVYRRRQEV